MQDIIITIGRDPSSDIAIADRWETVSNRHGEIECSGGQLTYYDHSTNGTIVAGRRIHNGNTPMRRGDSILLAGVCRVDWTDIERLLPTGRPTVERNIHAESGHKTERFRQAQGAGAGGGQPIGQPIGQSGQGWQPTAPSPAASGQTRTPSNPVGGTIACPQEEIDRIVASWSWPGFLFGWIFAAAHKVYWPIAIIVVCLIPFVGTIASIALIVYMGLKGSRMAWNSGRYRTPEQFRTTMRIWTVVGVAWMCLCIGLVVFSFIVITNNL